MVRGVGADLHPRGSPPGSARRVSRWRSSWADGCVGPCGGLVVAALVAAPHWPERIASWRTCPGNAGLRIMLCRRRWTWHAITLAGRRAPTTSCTQRRLYPSRRRVGRWLSHPTTWCRFGCDCIEELRCSAPFWGWPVAMPRASTRAARGDDFFGFGLAMTIGRTAGWRRLGPRHIDAFSFVPEFGPLFMARWVAVRPRGTPPLCPRRPTWLTPRRAALRGALPVYNGLGSTTRPSGTR
jgi:hypothetical protein